MVKNQFIRPLGVARKQFPAEQLEAAEPQVEQIWPTPASQGSAVPSPPQSPPQSSGRPYGPTESPYLQAPHNLPGIPALPSMQKKGDLKHTPLPPSYSGQLGGWAGSSNGTKLVGNFVPPSPPSSINPGNVPAPTNRQGTNGNFSPSSIYSQGNVPEPVDNWGAGPTTGYLQSGTGNLPLGRAPGGSSPLPYPQTDRLERANLMFPVAPPEVGYSNRMTPNVSYRPDGFAPGMPEVLSRSQGTNAAFQRVDPLSPPGPKSLKRKRKKPLPIGARIAIGLLVFLVIVTGGTFAYYQMQIAPALNNIIGKQAIHRTDSQTSDGQTNNQNDTGTVPTGRTNILLLGSDTDGKGNDPNNGIPLAQTVMILTVDPQTSYVGMLSIPRDMQVTEDGYTEPKLDEVFSHGYTGKDLQNKVASGAGEMEDIIRYNFGIHIDYYAWVGLGGFVKVIDTAGGIDVDTIHPMVDDTYPDDVGNTTGSIFDYKRLYIAPGPQHLDGLQALDYVRTRHSDLIGDFGRTVRQQQMIGQLKIKLATSDTIGKTSELLQDLNGAVQTDMQLSDLIGLGNLARGVDSNKIDHLTLGPPDYAVPNTDGARTSNYLPVCGKIVPAIHQMFNIRSPQCVSQFTSRGVPGTKPTAYVVGTAVCPCPSPTVFNTSMVQEAQQGSGSNGLTKKNAIMNTEGDSIDTGVHSLLDLLLATTFESFNAMQV